ncbi:MAG: hypothetical protein D4R67_06440 [Bacteroidetes bacterium]|nr:MAG: hypothetical protein D4R67_06440 [Bacteroidota bacterium]
MAFYPLLIFAGGGVWRRSLHDLHAFHLSIDSLVLKKVADDADSLFVECDTTWIIRGSMPEYLSGGPLSGSGDSYVMFQTLQENPYDEDRMNEFTLVSSRGDSVGFLVIQSGKNSGIPENGSPDLLVSVR